jgi:hypothetical protein
MLIRINPYAPIFNKIPAKSIRVSTYSVKLVVEYQIILAIGLRKWMVCKSAHILVAICLFGVYFGSG